MATSFHPVGSPVHIYSGYGPDQKTYNVYGWLYDGASGFIPVVGNPDGPGVGPWTLFYGEDPWYAS